MQIFDGHILCVTLCLDQIFEQMAPYKIKSSADLNYKYSEFASCMHPNDAGHARYFEEVIAPMIELFLKDRNGN